MLIFPLLKSYVARVQKPPAHSLFSVSAIEIDRRVISVHYERKRMAKELVRRFSNKFSNDFEKNKHMVNTLVTGGTPKVRNQIAGYITCSFAAQAQELREQTVE
jgi:ribosomal protein S17E